MTSPHLLCGDEYKPLLQEPGGELVTTLTIGAPPGYLDTEEVTDPDEEKTVLTNLPDGWARKLNGEIVRRIALVGELYVMGWKIMMYEGTESAGFLSREAAGNGALSEEKDRQYLAAGPFVGLLIKGRNAVARVADLVDDLRRELSNDTPEKADAQRRPELRIADAERNISKAKKRVDLYEEHPCATVWSPRLSPLLGEWIFQANAHDREEAIAA